MECALCWQLYCSSRLLARALGVGWSCFCTPEQKTKHTTNNCEHKPLHIQLELSQLEIVLNSHWQFKHWGWRPLCWPPPPTPTTPTPPKLYAQKYALSSHTLRLCNGLMCLGGTHMLAHIDGKAFTCGIRWRQMFWRWRQILTSASNLTWEVEGTKNWSIPDVLAPKDGAFGQSVSCDGIHHCTDGAAQTHLT